MRKTSNMRKEQKFSVSNQGDLLDRNKKIDPDIVAAHEKLEQELRKLGVVIKPSLNLEPPLGRDRTRLLYGNRDECKNRLQCVVHVFNFRKRVKSLCFLSQVAGALGFEPRLADPESAVLPLYDAPKTTKNYLCKKSACQTRTDLANHLITFGNLIDLKGSYFLEKALPHQKFHPAQSGYGNRRQNQDS